MSAVFELHENTVLFEREKKRFLASVAQLEATPHEIPSPRRTQNRETEWTLATADELVQRPASDSFTKPEGDELGMTQQVLGLARGSKQESPFDTVRVFDTTTLNTVPATDLGAPGFVNSRDTDPSLPAN